MSQQQNDQSIEQSVDALRPAQSTSFDGLGRALGDAVTLVARSVLHVDRAGAGARRHREGGTAIVWSDDIAISSSFHTPDVTRVGITQADGSLEERVARVVGRDPGTDVAVLRVDGGGLTPPQWRDLDDLAVGTLTLAVGRPGQSARASLRIVGVLGPAMRTETGGVLDRYVETDRTIPRGFAGGPLIDGQGRVIGMNTRTLFHGADIAVPTSTLRRVVTELLAHGGIRRGVLGVGVVPATLPEKFVAEFAQTYGALIAHVVAGGAASSAGLLQGDLLLRLGEHEVDGPESLRRALWELGGQTVELVVVRAGNVARFLATIGMQS